MPNKNKDRDHIYDESIYHFMYLFRKTIPKSKVFYLAAILLKFISIIDSTRNTLGLESDITSIDDFLSKLYMRNLFDYTTSSYLGVCIFIVIVLIVYLSLIFFFRKMLQKAYAQNSLGNKMHKCRGIKRGIKALSYFTIMIFVISQHLNEYLFFQFYVIYVTNDCNYQTTNPIMINFKSVKFSTKVVLCVINTISIILIEIVCLLCLYYSHYFSFNPTYGFSGTLDWIYYVLLIMADLFQGPVATIPYFGNSNTYVGKPLISLIITIINIFFIIIFLRRYLFSFIDYLVNSIMLFISISGVIEILLYLLETKPFTLSMSIAKLMIEIVNTIVLFIFINYFKKKALLRRCALKLFNENQKSKFNLCITFIAELDKCLKTERGFYQLSEIFLFHSQKCTVLHCPCHVINKKLSSSLLIDKTKLIDYYTIVAEQEIIHEILLSNKSSLVSRLFQRLIIIHVEVIFSIKKSYYHSLYLAQSYSCEKRSSNYSFRTKYLLYEYKRIILNKLKVVNNNLLHSAISHKKDANKYLSAKEYIKINQLVSYLLFLEKVKKNLHEACLYLGKLIKFRNTEMKKLSNSEVKCQTFISFAQGFEDYDKLIVKELTQTYSISNKLRNKEMCYLISNYYTLIYRIIPREIKEMLTYNMDLSSTSFKDELSEIKLSNPIIMTLNNEDNFIIKYISKSLCNKLQYQQSQLINKDFNVLMPEFINETHTLYMKLFCLSGNNTLKKTSFYFDEKSRIVYVRIKGKIYPSIKEGLSLIISNVFKEHNNYNQARYQFLLNDKLNIMAINEPFEEHFFLNQKILDILKVNFCSFFSLNQDKMIMNFRNYMKTNQMAKKENIDELNKAISILNSCKIENIFYFRKKKRLEIFNFTYKPIHDIKMSISNLELFNSVTKIEKEIEDLGLDSELNYRMMFLKERLRINNEFQIDGQVLNKIEISIELKRISDIFYFISTVKENLYSIDKIRDNFQVFKNGFSYYNIGDAGRANTNMSSSKSLKKKLYNHLDVGYTYQGDSNAVYNGHLSTKSVIQMASPLNSSFNKKKHQFNLKPGSIKYSNVVDNSTRTVESNMNSQLRLVSKGSTSKMFYIKEIDNQLHKDLNGEAISIQINQTKYYPSKTNSSLQKTNEKATKNSKPSIFLRQGYHYIYWVMVIALTIVHLIKIFLSYSLLEHSKNLFFIFLHLSITMGDLSLCSMYIISNCLETDKIHPSNNFGTVQFLYRQANEMTNNFYFVKYYANKISNANAQMILQAIHEDLTLQQLFEDFHIKERNSSIWEEIFYFHYIINSNLVIKGENEKCRVKQYFYKEKFKNDNQSNVATDKERLFFYSIYNVLPILKVKIQQIIKQEIREINKYNLYMLRFLEWTTISGIVLIIGLYTSLIVKIVIIRTKLITQVSLLTTNSQEDGELEENLKKLINIIINFNAKTIKNYEKEKNKIEYSANTPDTQISILKPNFTKVCNSKMLKIKSKHQIAINDNKHAVRNPYKVGVHQNDNKETEHSRLNKERIIIQPMIVYFAFILTIIMVLILLIVSITDILLAQQSFNSLNKQTMVGYNIVQRTPTIIDICLYSIISIIMNNEYYMTSNQQLYDDEKLTNYYGIDLKGHQETAIVLLNRSYYSFLYYHFQIQRGNILMLYTNDNRNKKVFQKIHNLEQNISDSSNFITEIAVKNLSIIYHGELNIRGSIQLTTPIFVAINKFVKTAKSIGNGMNIKGLNPALDLMLHEMNNNYLNFHYSNDTDSRDLTQFLSYIPLIYSSENVQFMLAAVHNIYSHIIIEDMVSTYDRAHTYELGPSLILLFSNLLFSLIILFVVLNKLQKTINLIDKTEMIIVNRI